MTLTDFKVNMKNLKSINIRSITIIKQIQSINLLLNMKDIGKDRKLCLGKKL
jgi:hypothetical protein